MPEELLSTPPGGGQGGVTSRVAGRHGRLVDSCGPAGCPAPARITTSNRAGSARAACPRRTQLDKRNYLFTSESVTEGHPDKLADQISDSILDAILKDDPYGRVACETLVTTGLAFVAGEITTETYVDIPKIVRQTVKDVGYTSAHYGYDYETCGVMVAIDEQSPDISQGVTTALEVRTDVNDDDVLDTQGAGDQGMMFGYACTETTELMPMPILLAHKLSKRLADVRKAEILPYLRPDGKSQVTIRYEDNKPVEIVKIVLATQHAESADLQSIIYPDLLEHVVEPIMPKHMYDVGQARGHHGHQRHRQVRHRRPHGRLWPHRTQDRRRHVRRRRSARRRRLLGQGPEQGRPLGRLRRPLRGQERRRRRPRRASARSRWPTPSASPTPCP